MDYANSHNNYRTSCPLTTLSAPEVDPWKTNSKSAAAGTCTNFALREGYNGQRSKPSIKEGYESNYRTLNQCRNFPSINVGSCSFCEQSCQPISTGCDCDCNRLSSDLSDPCRTRYPIDFPVPFEDYELRQSSCPECLQVMKYNLQ